MSELEQALICLPAVVVPLAALAYYTKQVQFMMKLAMKNGII